MSTVSQGLTPIESYRELTDFARRCGEHALRLAMHAAVPQTFRANLLHLLKLNFLPDAARDSAVEADVLLAPFTEDLSGGYYKFDPEVRRQLLERLNAAHPQRQGTRVEKVARFLAGYIAREEEKLESFADPLRQSFLDVQRWVALAHLDPDSTARQLAYALEHTEENVRAAVRLQIGGLIRSLSAPLAVHPELLIYAAGLRSLEEGRFQEGQQMLKRLGQGDVVIAGVKMRAVDTVLSEWKIRLEPAPPTTGMGAVEHGTIMIVTEAGAASWASEPLYQHWMSGGFQPECLSMEDVWFTTEDEALRFATGHNAAFLILDERFLDLDQERVSAIFGLPSLPVIPVWRPRLAKPGAREQYLSQRVQFGWWVLPIQLTQGTPIAEKVQASVAAIRAWTTASENALEVALQQLDFFQQYQPRSLEGLSERVVSGAQTLRHVAQDAVRLGDLARARTLLQNADTAMRKTVGEGAESFYIQADLAEVLTRQGEFAAAKALWEQLLNASQLINSKTLQLSVLAGLGQVFAGLDDPKSATETLSRALAIARELNDTRGSEIQALLEKLHSAAPEQSRPRRAGDVFFAYSHRDQRVVLNIRDYLERQGVPCWNAPRDIPAGTEWADEITRAIDGCRVLIVILSNASNDSRLVVEEVRQAIAAKKPILPIRIELVEPSEELAFHLTRLQWLDVIDNLERQLPMVYNAVQSLFGREQIQQTPPPSAPRPAPGQGQIYVSYSSRDGDRVGRLVSALERSGYSVWWDRKILPGQRWDEVLRQQLEQARCVLIVLTRNSVESQFVTDEATEALRRNILIPVLMDDAPVPVRLTRIQAARLVDWNGQTTHPDFQRLVQAISVFVSPHARAEVATIDPTQIQDASQIPPSGSQFVGSSPSGRVDVYRGTLAGDVDAPRAAQELLMTGSDTGGLANADYIYNQISALYSGAQLPDFRSPSGNTVKSVVFVSGSTQGGYGAFHIQRTQADFDRIVVDSLNASGEYSPDSALAGPHDHRIRSDAPGSGRKFLTAAFFASQIVESFQTLTGKANPGRTDGEAVSRVLVFKLTPEMALVSAFNTGVTQQWWQDGHPDFVNDNSQDSQSVDGNAAGVMFLLFLSDYLGVPLDIILAHMPATNGAPLGRTYEALLSVYPELAKVAGPDGKSAFHAMVSLLQQNAQNPDGSLKLPGGWQPLPSLSGR